MVWVRQLLEEIGLGGALSSPTIVYADNRQANNTAGNMYFRTTYHYNKEMVRDGYVKVEYIHTASNLADACTKALGSVKIGEFEPKLHGYADL